MNRLLALLVVVLGIVCLGVGAFFIYQGVSKNNWLVDNIKQEKITLGLTQDQIKAGKVLESMADLQNAGDTIRTHRHTLASTYNEALGGGQYDPTNPKEATYAQAMNLENYLYLGVLSLGVVQVVEGTGAFMIVVAVALWAIGVILWRLSGRKESAG
jgi:hypothetical protein